MSTNVATAATGTPRYGAGGTDERPDGRVPAEVGVGPGQARVASRGRPPGGWCVGVLKAVVGSDPAGVPVEDVHDPAGLMGTEPVRPVEVGDQVVRVLE